MVTILYTHFLNPGVFNLILFLSLLTPLVYLFAGRLLARTKRTLKSQGIFVSNVAHELNGSMTAMQLDSEFALQKTDSNYRLGLSKIKSQELIDALKTDLAGLKNMANIIQNLSTIASYEYKPGQLELKQVNLTLLLARLCKEVTRQSADKKHIKIKMNNKSPVYILGNEAALEQMIMNLLNNAVKYSPEGGKINASVSTDLAEVIMSIKDTGIGISEEDALQMFDPFYI